MRLRLAALVVALCGVVAGALPAAAASSDPFSTPRKYYLSLGDSLAFGFQQARANALFPNEDPAAFHTGYADDFAAILREERDGLQLVNFGCPGETTVSFINGPCPYPFALHDAYTQPSQLATAIAFLSAHKDQVNPITIDIGSNDTTQALEPVCLDPTQAVACQARLGALLQQLGGNLATIIATLHAYAPRSEILVLDLYNPIAANPALAQASDQIAGVINSTITTVASSQGAVVADVFGTFNPPGAAEAPTLCVLTAICTSLHDTHPTDAGYALMALKLWQASGFAREDG